MTRAELATIVPFAALVAGAVGVHSFGRSRLGPHGGAGRAPSRVWREAWLFRAGAAMVVLATLPPLGRWAQHELFARAMVDVGLAFIVAPLLVLGAPWPALAAGTHPVGHLLRRRAGVRTSMTPATTGTRRILPTQSDDPGSMRRFLTHPVAGLMVLLVVLAVWHLPSVLDAGARSAPLWDLQMACYLAGGVLLWTQLVGSFPHAPAWPPLTRSWLVVGAFAATSVLGAAMVFSPSLWYRAFATGHGALVSASLDQGFAGAITWSVPAFPLGIVAMWCYAEWMRQEEDEDLTLSQLIGRTRGGPVLAAMPPGPDSAGPENGRTTWS